MLESRTPVNRLRLKNGNRLNASAWKACLNSLLLQTRIKPASGVKSNSDFSRSRMRNSDWRITMDFCCLGSRALSSHANQLTDNLLFDRMMFGKSQKYRSTIVSVFSSISILQFQNPEKTISDFPGGWRFRARQHSYAVFNTKATREATDPMHADAILSERGETDRTRKFCFSAALMSAGAPTSTSSRMPRSAATLPMVNRAKIRQKFGSALQSLNKTR